MKRVISRLWLASSIAFTCLATISPAQAQIVPDNTLPVNSSVTPGCTVCTIDGGTVRGVNLFHSFQSFSVPTSGAAFFNNALQIENIFSRVTGGSVSNIDGLLRTNGTASLFFLNPNGIIFGPNARLDIGGSFFASTANSVKFPDRSEFSATNPQAPPLLMINVTPGVQWGASKPGATISNTGNLAPRQDLTLVADKLDLQGQLQAGRNLILQAQDTVKVRDSVTVPFLAHSGGNFTIKGDRGIDILVLNHPGNALQSEGNLSLVSDGTIWADAHFASGGDFSIRTLGGLPGSFGSRKDPIFTVSGNYSVGDYTGSSLQVTAGGNINYGTVVINDIDPAVNPTNPALVLKAGGNITGTGDISTTLDGEGLLVDFQAGGNISTQGITTFGGTINLNSTGGAITANGSLDSSVTGSDNGGTINLVANGDIITGELKATTISGNGGDISLISRNGAITATGELDANTKNIPSENGGNITLQAQGDINTRGMRSDGGDNGKSGAITITSNTGTVSINGGTINSLNYGKGKGGDINITAKAGSIFLENAAQLVASTVGQGNAGSVNINARDTVSLEGILDNDGNQFGGAFSTVERGAVGNGGNINITAGSVSVTDGAQVLSRNNGGRGNAGSVTMTARDTVTIAGFDGNGDATVGSDVASGGIGNGNDLNITARSVVIKDQAIVAASIINGRGENGRPAQAGNVNITATDTLSVNNSVVFSEVGSRSVGNGGDINITAPKVSLDNGASLNTQIRNGGRGNAGNINVTTDSLSATGGSQLFSSTRGRGNAGNVKITASDTVSFNGVGSNRFGINTTADNPSGAFSTVESTAVGNAGGINITASSVSLSGNGQVSVATSGDGTAGNVAITSDSLTVAGGAKVSATTATATPSAQGGSISVNASQVNLSGKGGLFAETQGAAPAGALMLQPNNNGQTLTVNLQDGSQISASTSGSGRGGTLTVTAPESITLSGNGTVGATADAASTGQAGDVILSTQQLTVGNGVRVSASTNSTNPSATGGNLSLQASQVNLTGGSTLSAGTTGAAPGGNLTIQPLGNGRTLNINFQDESTVSASTSGSGRGGTVAVTAPESVTLSGNGSVAAGSTGSGAGGNLILKTGKLTVRDGAQATVSSRQGARNAGDLKVSANSVLLDNQGKLIAETTSGEGGNIELEVEDLLLMRHNSLISAQAGNNGNGGNITIKRGFIVAVPKENSDIVADADRGNGGNINITTQGIFGLQFRKQRTPLSEITASSNFGISGTVLITRLAVDPSSGLVQLPEIVIDPSNQIVTGCAAARGNSFTVTGRGGLPEDPTATIRGQTVWRDLQDFSQGTGVVNAPSQNPQALIGKPSPRLVEANSWVFDEKGNVVLVAVDANGTSSTYRSRQPNCQDLPSSETPKN
jgi:filamentous hemagglutinin family protein